MDEAHERSHILDLVGLHVPREVPLDVARQHGGLGCHLLDVILTKHALPSIVGLAERLDGLVLGYGKQAHPRGE